MCMFAACFKTKGNCLTEETREREDADTDTKQIPYNVNETNMSYMSL